MKWRMPYPISGGSDADQKPGGPAPAAAQGQDELPEWLSKIPGVDVSAVKANKELVEQIRGGWLREQDYTKKTQEIAPLRKLKEKVGDRDLEAELNRLAQYDQWRESEYPKLEAQANRVAELERVAQANDKQAPQSQGPKSDFSMSPDDFFEQERLTRKLGELEQHLDARHLKSTKEWYEKEELPRLDQVAGTYLGTALGLIRAIWPRNFAEKGITVDRLMKEAVASQDWDYPKLVQRLWAGQETVKKAGYDEGYQKALAEAKAASIRQASPPPPNYGSPTWRRPPGPSNGKPSKGDLFDSVMKDVTAKHGAL